MKEEYTRLKVFKSYGPNSCGAESAVMKKDQVVELWNFYRDWYKELERIRKNAIDKINKISSHDEALKTRARVVHYLSDTAKDKLYRDKLEKQSLERDIMNLQYLMYRVQRIRDGLREVTEVMWDRHNQKAEIAICWEPGRIIDPLLITVNPNGTDEALYKAILERKYMR